MRKIYGPGFAAGHPATETLAEILAELDEPSLTKLVHDHEGGHLADKIERGEAEIVPGRQPS